MSPFLGTRRTVIANFSVTSDSQFGFKKNSCCSHTICSMRCVVLNLVLLLICDRLTSPEAFDKMNHYGLFIIK